MVFFTMSRIIILLYVQIKARLPKRLFYGERISSTIFKEIEKDTEIFLPTGNMVAKKQAEGDL